MPKITDEHIVSLYAIAKEVYAEELSMDEGINELVSKGINSSSASDYIRNFKHMLRGEGYKRTNSKAAMDYFLKSIKEDFGVSGLNNALIALSKHISYYENHTGTNSNAQRSILEKYFKELSSEPVRYEENSVDQITKELAKQSSIDNMITNAYNAALQSGKENISVYKKKFVDFSSKKLFQEFLNELIKKQKDLCALTQIPLEFEGTHTSRHLLCSLDRIDSGGNYESKNLQVVCQFINLWKQTYNNDVCIEMINKIRQHY